MGSDSLQQQRWRDQSADPDAAGEPEGSGVARAVVENQARQLRDSAAEQVEAKRAASLAAQNAKAKVDEVVASNQAVEADAKKTVNEAIANRNSMQAQLDSVTNQINARDAAQALAAQTGQTRRQDAAPAPAPAASGGGKLFRPANGPYTSFLDGDSTRPLNTTCFTRELILVPLWCSYLCRRSRSSR